VKYGFVFIAPASDPLAGCRSIAAAQHLDATSSTDPKRDQANPLNAASI